MKRYLLLSILAVLILGVTGVVLLLTRYLLQSGKPSLVREAGAIAGILGGQIIVWLVARHDKDEKSEAKCEKGGK